MLIDAIKRKPKNAEAHAHLAYCYQLQDRFEEAEREAELAIELDPEGTIGTDALAFVYAISGKYDQAVPIYVRQLPFCTFKHRTYFNLYHAYSMLNDQPKRRDISQQAVPEFERWLKLHPDDFYERVCYCVILMGAGREEEARAVAGELSENPIINGKALYNLACFYLDLRDKESALGCLRQAIAAGFRGRDLIAMWKDSELFREESAIDGILDDLENDPAKSG